MIVRSFFKSGFFHRYQSDWRAPWIKSRKKYWNELLWQQCFWLSSGLQEALFPYQSGWSFFSIWFRILWSAMIFCGKPGKESVTGRCLMKIFWWQWQPSERSPSVITKRALQLCCFIRSESCSRVMQSVRAAGISVIWWISGRIMQILKQTVRWKK